MVRAAQKTHSLAPGPISNKIKRKNGSVQELLTVSTFARRKKIRLSIHKRAAVRRVECYNTIFDGVNKFESAPRAAAVKYQ
jgi:hypothetical protein